jgi:outer membrane protein TolC
MNCTRKIFTLFLAALTALPTGCLWRGDRSFEACAPPGAYERVASEIEYPAESDCTVTSADPSLASPQPWTIDTQGTPEYWDVSLEEVIQLALANSRVLRDVGGAVVRSPATTRTALDPAIAETDPRFGIEAALSEFDAQFMTSTYWEKNDRALNNEFFGGGTRILQQDVGVFQAAITKRAATGSRFTIRHNVDYDANNAPGNLFDSAWNTNVEMELRHPFLQGSGTQYNRIAGLDNIPGVYDGVLIARLNADVALNDFEIAVRDLVSNVESAYWDLYFGYRVLDARVKARNASLDTWRKIHALFESNRRGGEAEKEAQAREQYFRFQEDVQNALSGEPFSSTRNWNGLPGGAFSTTGGVLTAERRLRLLIGLPPSDCKLLRPTDEPVLAKIEFDWCQVADETATRRAELRRQKWQVRRRELELMASKNHLLPRLDGVGRYRWRGFGDDLFNRNEPPLPRFDNAYADLASGDFQEWQLGFELSMPIGFRQAHVAARNAELLLARERAILQDQQREVIHEAADAIAEMDRAYVVLQTSYNRLLASRDQMNSVQAAYENDKAPLDLFLEAQRRLADAEVDYALSRASYALATKNVHFVKGTLLDYDGVYLAEGPWPGEAYHDSAKREASRGAPMPLNYASSRAPVVSNGLYGQHTATPLPPCETIGETTPDAVEELPTPDAQSPTPTPAEPTPTDPSSIPAELQLPISPDGAQPMPMGSLPALRQPKNVQASPSTKPFKPPMKSAAPSEAGESPGDIVPVIHFNLGPDTTTEDEAGTKTSPTRLPPAAGS